VTTTPHPLTSAAYRPTDAYRDVSRTRVASGTTVVELLRLAEEALMALDAGEIDVVKKLLRAFAAAVGGASGERTGCGPPAER
jgi:hypothetical protein